MVTLYHFMRIWGIPDGSPFCVKLEAYLRMAGIEYKADNSFDIRKAPKGKMPLIEHKGKIIADTSIIIDYLKKEFGDTLDGRLTEEQKAQGLCLQRMIEEHLYWSALYFRWAPDAAWQQLKPSFFGHMPMPLKLFLPDLIRKDMVKQVHAQGTGRHSEEEITKMAKDDLDAMATLLGNQKYFFGDQPTSFDASAFGLLANLYHCPIPSPVKDYAETLPSLKDYCARIKGEYFSDITASAPVAEVI